MNKNSDKNTSIRKVYKVGDSLVITLPKEYVEANKVKIGDYYKADFNGTTIEYSPVK